MNCVLCERSVSLKPREYGMHRGHEFSFSDGTRTHDQIVCHSCLCSLFGQVAYSVHARDILQEIKND